MWIRKVFVFLAVASLVAVVTREAVEACMGSPQPPKCSQTIYLSKFCPVTVVNRGPTEDTVAPIGLLPVVVWDAATPGCAQPIAAELTLTLTCAPAGGGDPVEIGPVSVPVVTPTTPGPQTVEGSGGQTLGGPFQFVIPAGALPAGSHVCVVQGVYTVTFGAGTGSGVITGRGDSEVCIVEPSPSEPGIPRLGMQRLDMGEGLFAVCHPGDQSFNFYLITNNDPNHAVTLDFHSQTNQVAVMPEGDTGRLYSTSTPGDNFFQSLPGDLPPDGLIPEQSPFAPGAGQVNTALTIPPFGLDIIQVAIRSHGMCLDGSCVDVLAKVTGQFANGDPALACCGTAVLLSQQQPVKTPLCDLTDRLFTGPDVDTFWSECFFNKTQTQDIFGDPHLFSTHASGNRANEFFGAPIFPPPFIAATQTSGQVIAPLYGQEDFIISPPPVSHLRVVGDPIDLSRADYQMQAFLLTRIPQSPSELPDGVVQRNNVSVFNIPPDGVSHYAYLVGRRTNSQDFSTRIESFFDVFYDLSTDGLAVRDHDTSQTLYDGTVNDLFQIMNGPPENNPFNLFIEAQTCREFTKFPIPDKPVLCADPPFFAGVNPPMDFNVRIFDCRSGNDLPWAATSGNPTLLGPLTATGAAGDPLQVMIDLMAIPQAPFHIDSFFDIMYNISINGEVRIPIAVRNAPPPQNPVLPGQDYWSTPCGGQSHFDFGMHPIPPDFFGPGSEPFTGRLDLCGDPSSPDPLFGNTDTIIRRNDPFTLNGPGSQSTVPIELVQLSLVSVQPIVVNTGSGNDTFDVRVDLSPVLPSGPGSMTVTRTLENGGTFDATLPVVPRFTFTNVNNPTQQLVLNGMAGNDTFEVNMTGAGNYLNTITNGISVWDNIPPKDGTADFVPGVTQRPGSEPGDAVWTLTFFESSEMRLALMTARTDSPVDTDGDSIPDDGDNCPDDQNPLQEDADGDLVGDLCDNCPDAANYSQADFNSDGTGDACQDSDGDDLLDSEEDLNGNGTVDPGETDPLDRDTDGDGYWDGFERQNLSGASDPTNPDDTPPPTGVAGDVNLDGVATSVDVQFTILGALDIATPFPTDLSGDGLVTSVDVQLAILGALAKRE